MGRIDRSDRRSRFMTATTPTGMTRRSGNALLLADAIAVAFPTPLMQAQSWRASSSASDSDSMAPVRPRVVSARPHGLKSQSPGKLGPLVMFSHGISWSRRGDRDLGRYWAPALNSDVSTMEAWPEKSKSTVAALSGGTPTPVLMSEAWIKGRGAFGALVRCDRTEAKPS